MFTTYIIGFLVNGSVYKQAFFPRTSPGWQRTMFFSCVLLPCASHALA